MSGTDGAGGDWDAEVSSKFADRPMLKALHRRFPGGAPPPPEKPTVPSHEAMLTMTHDRRVPARCMRERCVRRGVRRC